MNSEPRFKGDYSERQTTAAHRVLVDLGQVLASFRECVVLVGGWVPDLLLTESTEPHVMSIDVDLALDAGKLSDGRYAELLKLLIDTRRYQLSEKHFQLFTVVDLEDGQNAVRVDVDFLAPKEFKLRSTREKKIQGFRVLQTEGCGVAFRDPEPIVVKGHMVDGAVNSVEIRVAALPDFLVMKCYALHGRDKPKDAYDICFCLDQVSDGGLEIAEDWKTRARDKNVIRAIEILRAKFNSPDDYGPRQVAAFNQTVRADDRARQTRRAFELVQRFLGFVSG
ncbi:MAG TPA: nucleotidyl transferase AbiEii/AbiGii toxin family protein [Opitutaceae bacterium]|jgi:hypothetical protein|nr:nucleotidyl transferase AbiEii/AbiGii toxin family protein [Opitutaceae bacterium]